MRREDLGTPLGGDLHRGVLTSGAADQLAALVARAAQAPSGLIQIVEGDRLRLYGGWELTLPWTEIADTPIADCLSGVVLETGAPLVITDLATDPRVPAGSPIRARGLGGAYVAHPVRDDAGAVIGTCCVVDVVPRAWSAGEIAAVAEAAQVSALLIREQVARHQVDRQRRFLDAVLDSLHDGVTACDADGRIVLVNRRMQQLWGDAPAPATVDDDAVVALLSDAAGNPLRREDIGLRRALRGETVRHEQLVVNGRNRRARHYLVDAQPIAGPDGRTVGAVQALQDVTRRRRAERFRLCELGVTTALAETPCLEAAGPKVLEAVVGTLDWVHAELWLVDEAAGLLRCAAHWSEPGRRPEIEVPGELAYGQGLAGRAWQAGKPLWIRDVGRPQSLISPETATVSRLHTALAVPVRDGSQPLGVLTAFADRIEDPEDEIVALMSGIAAHIGQFVERRLVEDLQRQLARSKDEYLSLVGHELRTPLTSISAYTELLRELDADALAADGPALLEVIERNTGQLRRIIDELLELSALDTGHAAVSDAPVDLAEVVRASAQATRAAIAGVPLEVRTDVPDRLVLPGDGRRLRQVVDNLLGNAVKYSPDGGRITVTLRADGGAAELSVADTGIGVSPEDRKELFTRLYRSSSVRDRAIPGTGLGLAMSRAVVQRHHGTIEIVDHDGPGTTVLVRLPLGRR
jgi:PAS domain S-box-containing protein